MQRSEMAPANRQSPRRYRHMRGIEHIVRRLGTWRKNGNTLPPVINALYRRNLSRCQAGYAVRYPDARAWPELQSVRDGYAVVRDALSADFAAECRAGSRTR